MINLYSVFHLNLAFSSLEEEQRSTVIDSCYAPLLSIVQDLGLPLGIEASGYTLLTIAREDPSWIEKLRSLLAEKKCELIGSGYAQLIGPLVPAEVNKMNLRLGMEVYEDILGVRPQIALINEQAFSCGLLQHYLDAGFKAIIMEWDNPFSQHPEWDSSWRYLPQYACGQNGEILPLIWNKSIAFQQFQRYAHGDQELDEYLTYLAAHIGESTRFFPLYGNDAEVFDFRPGRFATEPKLGGESEWQRIGNLFKVLAEDKRFQFVAPSDVLGALEQTGAGQELHLESAAQPVAVKKQGKYNLTRWAVTGRDDLKINSACYEIYKNLKGKPRASAEDWKELCCLWSSDFRTHITANRWQVYLKRLEAFKSRIAERSELAGSGKENRPKISSPAVVNSELKLNTDRSGKILKIYNQQIALNLNCNRGLAIEGLWYGAAKGPPLIGTLPHGFYEDIRYGADWYSGHMTMELLGRPKVTDLEPCEPVFELSGSTISVRVDIDTALGRINKTVSVDPLASEVSIRYSLDWQELPPGSLRLGHITLHPEAFDHDSLYYKTCNGGYNPEKFTLKGTTVDHGRAVSFLVSAAGGLGLTDGWIEMGDKHRALKVSVRQEIAALIGLVKHEELSKGWFARLAFSGAEMDETVRERAGIDKPLTFELTIRLLNS